MNWTLLAIQVALCFSVPPCWHQALLQLLPYGAALWSLLWLLHQGPSSRYAFSAWLGCLSVVALAYPVKALSLVWPSLWLRLGGLELPGPVARLTLTLLQLQMALAWPYHEPIWLLPRATLVLAVWLQLRPSRWAIFAGKMAGLAALGPLLNCLLTGQSRTWPEALGMAAVLLGPQVLLARSRKPGGEAPS